jgi:hypothetical protein
MPAKSIVTMMIIIMIVIIMIAISDNNDKNSIGHLLYLERDYPNLHQMKLYQPNLYQYIYIYIFVYIYIYINVYI